MLSRIDVEFSVVRQSFTEGLLEQERVFHDREVVELEVDIRFSRRFPEAGPRSKVWSSAICGKPAARPAGSAKTRMIYTNPLLGGDATMDSTHRLVHAGGGSVKKVAIIHTSFVSVEDLRRLFAEIVPEARLMNLVDDSLLAEVMANGGITPSVVRRMCRYFEVGEAQGADLIFNQCSSVGEAADIAARCVSIPVLKVDEAMAEEAVRLGRRIAVAATVASTLRPSCGLVRKKAAESGVPVEIVECLVEGALEVLMKEGDRPKHNRMVLAALEKVQDDVDVIVLAQGSMIVLLPELGSIRKPVLTSPRLGVEKARRVLGL
jgi:hypothetical protein